MTYSYEEIFNWCNKMLIFARVYTRYRSCERFPLFSLKCPSNRTPTKCREPEVQFRSRRRSRSPNLETLVPA